jgi:predicted NodU family carbamoyl transferase
MLVLGINNAYHDSSAALVDDGVVVAAIEQTRFASAWTAPASRSTG